jgi:tRNA 2-thiocytidine biosynthesis protein TtcA
MQRRTELLRYAAERGANKIALGHHLDDCIETFFMNMLGAGKADTMQPLVKYNKYPVSVIRPLILLEERQVIECAAECGIIKSVCTCPYGINSGRRKIRAKIAALTDNSGATKRRIFEAAMSACNDAALSAGSKESE